MGTIWESLVIWAQGGSKQTSLEEGKVERKKEASAGDSMAIQIVRFKTLCQWLQNVVSSFNVLETNWV